MNRRNFLIGGSTTLAGLFLVRPHAVPHETDIDSHTNER